MFIFSNSDGEIQLRLKNVHEESTTMEVWGMQDGTEGELKFKIGLMKPEPAWLRVLECILAVRAIPHEAVMARCLYPHLAQSQDTDHGGRTGGMDSWHLS